MHLAKSFLLIAVVVLGGRVAGLDAGIDKRPVQRIEFHVIASTNAEGPASASILIRAAIPGLSALVIRKA